MNSERADKGDVLQGTLILLVLRTIEALGPRRLEADVVND
jgi:hypothetical protein